MVHKYEIQGGPSIGYTMRCPHKLNVTENVRLTSKQQRRRYGLNRPTVERPLFVGTERCENCVYSLRYHRPVAEVGRFVYCSYPLPTWDVPRDELERVRRGQVDVSTDV